MIKNIVFDYGNVIVEWNEAKIVSNYSKEEEIQELLKETIFKSKDWLKLDNGSLNYEEAEKIFKEKLPQSLKETVEIIMSGWWESMEPNHEIHTLINNLKGNGYKIFLLSNTHTTVYEYIKKSEIGKYFDGYLISSIEKLMKPNEEIYYKLFEKFELVPEECYFIDDSKTNIEASKKCGMDGHVFNRNEIKSLLDDLKKKDVKI